MQKQIQLRDIRALVIDMDGVLWLGNVPLPGLVDFFDFLAEKSIPFVLATNNASKTPEEYMEKLAGFGVTVSKDRILTSSLATAAYLQRQLKPGATVYAVGQSGLKQAMRDAGFRLIEDASEPAEVVVAGVDFTLTYDKLKYATLLIRRGARFVGTNGDVTYPAEEGQLPGAGAILAAIQAATGQEPLLIGKPKPFMFEMAVDKMGSGPEQTATLGDRLETDILGGQLAGLRKILVTSGVDNEESIREKGITPDLIYSGIEELTRVWRQQL